MVRVGIVGTRFGRLVHLPAFRADARCEVVGIAGRTPESGARAAGEAGLAVAFPGWRALVEARDVDVVAIAVPPADQPEIAIAAARAGKHVFCEKPVAASLDAARQTLAAVDAARVAHAVDFLFPEVPAWVEARRRLEAGEIGRVVHFAYTWHLETWASRTHADSWKTRSADGGGALGNFASHVFHNIEWLIGPVAALEGFTFGSASRQGCAVDGAVVLESGAAGRLSVSTDACLGAGHVIEVFGERATLVLANRGADYVSGFSLAMGPRESGRLTTVTPPDDASAADGRIAAVARIVTRFVDAIAAGGDVRPGLREGVRVQALVAAAAAMPVAARVEVPPPEPA